MGRLRRSLTLALVIPFSLKLGMCRWSHRDPRMTGFQGSPEVGTVPLARWNMCTASAWEADRNKLIVDDDPVGSGSNKVDARVATRGRLECACDP